MTLLREQNNQFVALMVDYGTTRDDGPVQDYIGHWFHRNGGCKALVQTLRRNFTLVFFGIHIYLVTRLLHNMSCLDFAKEYFVRSFFDSPKPEQLYCQTWRTSPIFRYNIKTTVAGTLTTRPKNIGL